MTKLVPVGRRNPTLFVCVAQISHMKIIESEGQITMLITLLDGTHLMEQFDSHTAASEAAVRLCNYVNML